MTAPAGTEVGLYVDLLARVEVGDVIETHDLPRVVVARRAVARASGRA